MKKRSFEELEVWQEAKRLAVYIIKMWEGIESYGYYALKDQMQRSCISISSNIAEGRERKSVLEFLRFLFIAKGSTAELRSQLYIFKELEVARDINVNGIIDDTVILSKRISRLISSMNTKK